MKPTSFIGTQFRGDAIFDASRFDEYSLFIGSEFNKSALFRYAVFNRFSNFLGAKFKGEQDFIIPDLTKLLFLGLLCLETMLILKMRYSWGRQTSVKHSSLMQDFREPNLTDWSILILHSSATR